MTGPRKLTVAQALALAEQQLGRGALNDVVGLCRQVLQVEAENPDALHMLAIVANRSGKPERALEIAERALAARPLDPAIENSLGLILTKLGRLDDAEARLRGSLARERAPKQAWLNLAAVKERGNDFTAALEILGDLESRYGGDPATALSRTTVLQSQGRFLAALELLEAAWNRAPDDIDIGFARANLLLLLGRLAEGWPGFELRRQRALGRAPPAEWPAWDGRLEPGTRLLVYAEHGLGDVIQFARYVPHLIGQGLDVTFACYPALIPLLRTLSDPGRLVPDTGTIPDGGAMPACDFAAPLMSLPRLLGHGLPEIAALGAVSPYLAPEAEEVARIRAVLDAVPGLKVGIAWQGNPSHAADHERSIPIARYEPVMAAKGVTTVSLQEGFGERDIDPFKARYRIIDEPADKGGLTAIACLVGAVDLVITCDTAIGHLAGALGAPTWLALSAKPSWRWLLERDDSPWYPSLRLFRQKTHRDWKPVFAAMEAALAALAKSRGA